jgi:hypothetical protein
MLQTASCPSVGSAVPGWCCPVRGIASALCAPRRLQRSLGTACAVARSAWHSAWARNDTISGKSHQGMIPARPFSNHHLNQAPDASGSPGALDGLRPCTIARHGARCLPTRGGSASRRHAASRAPREPTPPHAGHRPGAKRPLLRDVCRWKPRHVDDRFVLAHGAKRRHDFPCQYHRQYHLSRLLGCSRR